MSLRSKNPFLPPLEAVAPELQDWVNSAVALLPMLSISLMEYARYFGGAMIQRYNKRTSDMNGQYLVLCVHDVQMSRVHGFLAEATHDPAIASNYAGALLYQAIGKSPRCDDQTIFLNLSYKLRGLEKYAAVARIFPKVADPIADTFGKEFAQLIFGRATEDVVLLGSSKLMEICLYTDANIRGVFLGQPFTDEERVQAEAACAEQDKKTSREIQELRKRMPSSGI